MKDTACQIRIIRRNYDDGAVYAVELGFYIKRGTRHVWYRENKGWIGYYHTRAEAQAAASAPALIARRDDLRRRRHDPPLTQPSE